MTTLEKLIDFTQSLPANTRSEFEMTLEAMMISYSLQFDLTADEIAEVDQRVADPNPSYADPAEIAAIFGKSFSL
ncbi:MAG: hypothetical protein ABJN35_14165 [Erythrobacter sp.]